MSFFSGMFYLYRSAHSFQCVKWFLLYFVGRAHWRAACSATGCQGLNRAASEVRFRAEISTQVSFTHIHSFNLTIFLCIFFAPYKKMPQLFETSPKFQIHIETYILHIKI